MENISYFDRFTKEYNVLPIILMLILVGGWKNEQYFCSIVQAHDPFLVIDEDRKTYLVKEHPFVLNESFVDVVQAI